MKKILLLLSVVLTTLSYAQNKGVILGSEYTPNIIPNNPPQPLPTSATTLGYQGQLPQFSQNIQVNDAGEIVFFIVDDYIFDRNGGFLGLLSVTENSFNTGSAKGNEAEIVVVPAPGDCNSFYIFTTARDLLSPSIIKPFLFKLTVLYDEFGNLLAGSGLVIDPQVDPFAYCYKKGIYLADVIGNDYNSNINVIAHNENPNFAVVSNNQGGFYFFLQNNNVVFKLEINESGVFYTNEYFQTSDFYDLQQGGNVSLIKVNTTELEVVRLVNGNYRLAYLSKMTNIPNFGPYTYNGLIVVDLDPNGTVLPNSQNYIRYGGNPSPPLVYIKGVEFSPNGEKLFVSHTTDNQYSSTLDMFDLTNPDPNSTRTIISSSTDFQHSQIEATFNGVLLIPTTTGIAAISNSNNPTFPVDLELNYISLGNYGIANTTSTPLAHQVRLLQDQIDGYNYSSTEISTFGADYFEVTGNQTWFPNGTGGSNPLVNGNDTVIYIKNELRIKAGATLNLNDLTIKFSPGARVVIENGAGSIFGGRLIMNNSIFTNENRCGSDSLWLGVEVWGNQNLSQPLKAGKLEIKDSSLIENALVGVLLSARKLSIPTETVTPINCDSIIASTYILPTAYDYSKNGGIVQGRDSEILNCPIGTLMLPYNNTNLSWFNNMEFRWAGQIKESKDPLAHVAMIEIKPVTFIACDFVNDSPLLYANSQYKEGYGIIGLKAQFYVRSDCNGLIPQGQLCQNLGTPSVFKDLNMGIYSSNAGVRTFTCDANEFINNRLGVYVHNTKKEIIVRNTFEVRESDLFQTAGIALYNSSGYKVEENELFEFDNLLIPNGTALSYGIVVNNSGEGYNEIYMNLYHDLKIGGQTERVNAISLSNTNNTGNPNDFTMNGLKWLCNDFDSNITEADMTAVDGKMNFFQSGNLQFSTPLGAKRAAARNTFSLQGEGLGAEHDIKLMNNSQNIQYNWIDAPEHKPDSYTVVGSGSYNMVVDENELLYQGFPITNDQNACPTKLIFKTIAVLNIKLAEIEAKRTEIEQKLDLANYDYLIDIIENTNGKGKIRKALLLEAPYVPNNVLITYIQSEPPFGHLLSVLLSNSPLNNSVLEELQNSNLPQGLLNIVSYFQSGTNPILKLALERSFLDGEWDKTFDEIVHTYLIDNNYAGNYDGLVSYLEQYPNSLKHKELLLEICLEKKDLTKADQTRSTISALNPSADYLSVTDVERDICNYSSTKGVLDTNSQVKSALETISSTSTDRRAVSKANSLLKIADGVGTVPDFLIGLGTYRSQENTFYESTETIDLYQELEVNIYPNPTSDFVTIDYPESGLGDMEVVIYNLEGKQVAIGSALESIAVRLDLSRLNTGFYIVKIIMNDVVMKTEKLEVL